ncbi:hypothetical protein COX26_00420 [Candidatus Jorgensenbacteria bacterium CG23_combo_of_CG06-09_8_20_14_all_54_14]|uniref:Uncharacterized protein n=1 Tax=Candidatus Jorgensenbacteria bacterium CG23_combo_of_CG06-09_8_20_14_all_54_14 TaxID=1974595 RepID=A0A2G9ZAE2_9BACT|nr:MAG: hypothetical protein COX26_00420 [Candidatus Jorgensenbacteria bacterium CG23_combo_of_CG06-09_8_20_14_all_54_14]
MMVFVRSRFLLACAGVSIALLLVSLTLVLVSVGNLEPPLVLHIGESGADLFGGVGSLYCLWGLGVVMVLVNTALGVRLFSSARALSYALLAGNVPIAILLLIAIGTIVSLN